MGQLNLSGILNYKKNLRIVLAPNLKFNETPIISYKFGKTIGQTLYNYNKVLNNISEQCLDNINCNCDSSLCL